MKISKLQVSNFGLIKDATIETEPDKSICIIGQNGSGKSTLLEAISLLYTGKMARAGYKITDYIGPYKDTFQVMVTHDDGTIIKRTPSNTSIVLPDGREFKKKTEVESVMPFDPDILFNIGYIKQFEIDSFFSTDKKNIIDNMVNLIVDITVANSAYKTLTKENTQLENEFVLMNNNVKQFEEMSVDIPTIEAELDEIKLKLDSINTVNITAANNDKICLEKISNVVRRLEEIDSEIEELGSSNEFDVEIDEDNIRQANKNYHKIYELKEHKEDFEKELLILEKVFPYGELVSKYLILKKESLENINDDNLEKIKKMNDSFVEIMTTEKHTTIDKVSTYRSFIKKYDDPKDLIEKIKEYKQISKHLSENIKEELQQLSKIMSLNPDTICDDLGLKIGSIKNSIDIINNELVVLENGYFLNDDDYNKIIKVITGYKIKINEREKYRTEYSKLVDMELTYKSLDEIEEAKRLYNISEEIKNTYKLKERELANAIDVKNKLDTNKELLELNVTTKNHIEIIRQVFKIIPSKARNIIFQSLTDIINNDFNKYFSFSEIGEIKIDFDKLQLTYANDRPISGLSGAQRNILFMMLRYSILKKLGTTIPLLMIDEPTIALDDERIIELKQFLSILGQNIQLWMVTHTLEVVDSNIFVCYDATNNFKRI
jgi:DNA sulfur modification protein DndD